MTTEVVSLTTEVVSLTTEDVSLTTEDVSPIRGAIGGVLVADDVTLTETPLIVLPSWNIEGIDFLGLGTGLFLIAPAPRLSMVVRSSWTECCFDKLWISSCDPTAVYGTNLSVSLSALRGSSDASWSARFWKK